MDNIEFNNVSFKTKNNEKGYLTFNVRVIEHQL
jgi:hypothetical protein